MRPRIVKKVIHAGRGRPLDFVTGAKALLDYQAQVLPPDSESDDTQHLNTADLPVIDDTRKRYPQGYGEPLELVFGKKFQIPIWEECLQTMLLDEVLACVSVA